MNYPTLVQVESANHEQLARWSRHLPVCQDEVQTEVINRIVERLDELGGFTPEISKRVGW